MRRVRFLLLLLGLVTFSTLFLRAADRSGFEGVWRGEIVAPNTRAPFGLAFTRTPGGLLVSLDFPAMFLHSANFGPASIVGDTFTLAPLHLVLTRRGDTLAGTFALAALPVELHRSDGAFAAAPPETTFPAAPPPVWSRALGAPAWASPAVREDIVYVGAVDGTFHAVHANDGSPAWTWRGHSGFHGEALVTDDAVYVVDDALHLTCLVRASGSVRWQLPLHDPKLAGGPPPENETFNHRATSPIIDEKGVLYVGSTDHGLYAIRAKNGRLLWRRDAGAPLYAAPTLAGDNVIAGCFDGTVFAVDRRRGRTEKFRVKLGGPVVSAPVLAGDTLVVGARDYQLYGLAAGDGTLRWRNTYWFSWVESTPRLADGILYIGGSDFRRVSALDPAQGHVLWATDVHGLSWGSPVVTPDAIFAATAGQTVPGTVIQHTGGIVKLDRQTGAILWRYEAPRGPGAGFTGFTGSLALAGRLIVGVRVDGTLLAFPADR